MEIMSMFDYVLNFLAFWMFPVLLILGLLYVVYAILGSIYRAFKPKDE